MRRTKRNQTSKKSLAKSLNPCYTRHMNKTLLKWLGRFCIVIVALELLTLMASRTQDAIDNYIDSRIRDAVRQERHYVYEDLAKLFPKRVAYTRRGGPYITEGE